MKKNGFILMVHKYNRYLDNFPVIVYTLIFISFCRKDTYMQILENMEFPGVDFGVPFGSCGWARNFSSIKGEKFV